MLTRRCFEKIFSNSGRNSSASPPRNFGVCGCSRKRLRWCPLTADEAQEFLSNLCVAERIAAVAEDVESEEQRFASIEVHDLAELLGVPQPEQPDDSWSRTTYAERQTLEEYVDLDNSIVEEFPDRLPSKTTPKRVQSVRALCEELPSWQKGILRFSHSQRAGVHPRAAR